MLQVHEKSHAEGSASDELWLPYDVRKRGRFKATTRAGTAIGVFLERGAVLRDGELLRCDSGQLISVRAAAEDVATGTTTDPLLLARACYHLGNRHVPLQIGPGYVSLQRDPVLEQLIERLGLQLELRSAAFHPEAGAYHSHPPGDDAHSHPHHDE